MQELSTAEQAEAVRQIEHQADGLADLILAAGIPDVRQWLGLRGLVRLTEAQSLFTPSERHRAALERRPPDDALEPWGRYLCGTTVST